MSLVVNPYSYFTDTNGNALNGYLYVGEVGKNAENYPIAIFYDNLFTTPAPNPLTISAGYIYNGGTIAQIYASVDYSIVVKKTDGSLVYSSLNETGMTNRAIANIDEMKDFVAPYNNYALNVLGYSEAGDGGGGLFYYDANSTEADNGGTIIEPTNGSGRWIRVYDFVKLEYFGVASPDYVLDSNWIWDATIDKSTANLGTIIDPSVGLDEQGTGSGIGCMVRQYSDAVNVKWFGAKGDGSTDDTVALQAAIDYCRENNRALFISAGEYLVTPGIDVTASSTAMNNFIMFGEPNSAGRHYSYPSKIVFDDDGTTTSGLIGMEIDYTPTFQNLMFSTTAGDARSTGGDFIGILTVGGSLKVQNCIFESCSGSAIKASDLGYASFTDCIFRYNGEGLTAYYINWTYGTTTAFNRVHGFQNNTALQVSGLYHSSFSDCIFEYNGYGIKDFRSGCVIENCYFEHNGTYGAFADSAGRAVLISNFTHGAQDAIYVTGSTDSFGFDSIGATKINGNNAQTRVLQFYTREGGDSKAIKCSHRSYSGELVLETSSGVVEGIIPTMFSAQSSGYATKMYNFLLKGATAYGTPTGFTITYVSTGRWSIDWDDATLDTSHRWPFIQVQGLNSTGTSYIPVIAYIQPRDSGGVWSAYASMSLGFDLYIYTVDPATGIHTLADRACMVQITI